MGLTATNPHPPPSPPLQSPSHDAATAMAGAAALHRQVHDFHVYGVITVVLETCLCLENLLPVLVVCIWRRPRDRSVSDKLLAALSAAYIMSALVPTPLGLASTFHGTWFGGVATCECFQVTSTWCSLSALALVTYISVDLHLSACGANSLPLPEAEGQRHRCQQNTVSVTVNDNLHSSACSATSDKNHDGHSYSDAHRLTSPQPDTDYPSTAAAQEGISTGSLKELQMTSSVSPPSSSVSSSSPCVVLPRGKDVANLLLFAVLTVTLIIASLPVIGYGPEVMPHNFTCDSWLVATPTSQAGRIYFVAFLSFGFLNILTTLLAVSGALLVVRSLSSKRSALSYRWEGEPRYMEERPFTRCGLISAGSTTAAVEGANCSCERGDSTSGFGSRSVSTSGYFYKMAGLILTNQAMWIPALVIITVQKVGYRVTDATMMYAILSTSLPGLLNPLLLALLFRDYRLGYRYILVRLCCRCCRGSVDNSSNMKDLRSTSMDSLRQLSDGEVSLNGCTLLIDDVTSTSANGTGTPGTSGSCSGSTHQQKKRTKKTDDLTQQETDDCANTYVVVEVPNERTPLQGQATARPIIASLYDEYGELGGAPKTELLSPCGSEECLLNPDLFRAQTESVV